MTTKHLRVRTGSVALVAVAVLTLALMIPPSATAGGVPVTGTVTALRTTRAHSAAPILTQVTMATTDGPRHFTMKGGVHEGLGMLTDEYADLTVGDRVVVTTRDDSNGVLELENSPIVLTDSAGSLNALAATDFVYDDHRWAEEDLPIPWRFSTTNAPTGALAALQAAADTWEADPFSSIDYTYQGTTAASPGALDGVNSVGWRQSTSSDTLATCTIWFYETRSTLGYNRIIEFEIDFNRSLRWSTAPDSSSFDIQSVALHEFGHSLRLADLHDRTATSSQEVMNGYLAPGATKRALGAGDLAGVRYIYPETVTDTAPPAVSTDVVPTYSATARITIRATDSGSGVADIRYRINGGPETVVNGSTASVVVASPGRHRLDYSASDRAGNTTTGWAAFDVLAATAVTPVTSASGVGEDWSSVPVVVTLSATGAAAESGTSYRVDGGPAVTYTGPVTFDTDGLIQFEYWSVCPQGVEEPHQRLWIRVDSTPPSVHSDPSRVYTDSALATITASDGLSGLRSLSWRLDGSEWRPATGGFANVFTSKPGRHLLEFRAEDLAGNASEGQRTFSVLTPVSLRISPTSPVTLTRRRGSATLRLSAVVSRPGGVRVSGTRVRLQRSTDGHSWATVATLSTSATGGVSRSVRLTRAGTTYWRWRTTANEALGHHGATSRPVRVRVR
jgi:hypothetical protein